MQGICEHALPLPEKYIKNLAFRFILHTAFPLGILIMEMYKVIINNSEFHEYNHCQYMLRIWMSYTVHLYH